MSNVFILTSAINSFTSIISIENRYEQTLKDLESIRIRDKNSIIVLAESSPNPVPQYMLDDLSKKVDYLLINSNIPDVAKLGQMGLKSPAEAYSLFVTIDVVEKMNIPNIQRIFKLTGRGELTDDFHIEDYDDPNLFGKYVFKKRGPSWISDDLRVLDTRIFSFCHSIIPEAKELMGRLVNHCLSTSRDLEHCILELVDKEKLVEWDVMGFKCQISATGYIQFD